MTNRVMRCPVYRFSTGELQQLFGSGVIFLQDSSCVIEGVTFYGTAWNNIMGPKSSAWGTTQQDRHNKIPSSTDVLITHLPSYDILDEIRWGDHTLRNFMTNSQASVHCFGHVHESNGVLQYSNGKTFSNAAMKEKQHPNLLTLHIPQHRSKITVYPKYHAYYSSRMQGFPFGGSSSGGLVSDDAFGRQGVVGDCIILHHGSGLVLDASDGEQSRMGTAVILWRQHGAQNQLWRVDKHNGIIRSAVGSSNLLLEHDMDNQNTILYSDWGGQNQRWHFSSTSTSRKIKRIKLCKDNRYLGAEHQQDGTWRLMLVSDKHAAATKWEIIPLQKPSLLGRWGCATAF
eukprot:TRINITY_DN55457_c0_g1_i1.p1 TRINITY_DN55457_c0_g1~~TRINITY_DN55457_c0_g1_i1.p1  ORF type:complete len:343 (+),score=34.47 TRINITY_DN55457_c0_g1_i1:128-1156(+)